ncbi:MAG: hypothetical protein WB764_18520, partial [Xanthobacteraceae bacterium]
MSDYVFNPASITPLYIDRAEAEAHLVSLLQALADLDEGAESLPTFRFHQDPWLIPMVADAAENRRFVLGEIANDLYNTPHHDEAAFFDSLSRAVPAESDLDEAFSDALLRIQPSQPVPGHESTFPSVQLCSFEAVLCAITNSVLASLPHSPRWNFDRMGFIENETSYLFDHVATLAHALAIRQRRTDSIREALNAARFWSLKGQAFPNLSFGLDVQRQVDRFSATILPLLFKRLAALDSKVVQWKTSAAGTYPDGIPEIVPETPQT